MILPVYCLSVNRVSDMEMTEPHSLPAQASVEEALANICTIVQADDKGELRKKMRRVQSDFKLKLRDYYSGITCSKMLVVQCPWTHAFTHSHTHKFTDNLTR